MSLHRQLLVIFCAIFSIFFLFKAGFLTIESYLIVPSSHPLQALAENTRSEISSAVRIPTQITIPSIRVDLPVFQSVILNGEWETTKDGVSLLTNVSDPEQKGYVLYGHNWKSLLGKLYQSKIGEQIVLTLADGTTQKYRITSIFKVDPKEVNILELSKPNTVLIYTCIGFLDSQRLMVLAELE